MIYENQSLLRLEMDTEVSLTGATVMRILYKKPDGTQGFWPVTLTSGTKLLYNVQDGDIDQAGTWQFQSYVEIDGQTGFGRIVREKVSELK
jgi:hypothetical protein